MSVTTTQAEPTVAGLLAEEKHDVVWLRDCLQLAVQIEFSTIPPYLYAYWCVQDPADDLADALLGIAWQEMLHMGLACNMLVAIGGKPDIKGKVPTYPSKGLPGKVLEELDIQIKGVSGRDEDENDALRLFMKIEEPRKPLATFSPSRTIGEFYRDIRTAFEDLFRNKPDLPGGGRQVSGRIGGDELFEVKNLKDALKAIDIITEQGEGTSKRPTGTDDPADLAHYYRFGEYWYGRRMRKLPHPVDGKEWEFKGDPIKRATLYPLGAVPRDGWGDAPGASVRKALDACNKAFTKMVKELQSDWTSPPDRRPGDEDPNPIGAMVALNQRVRELIDLQKREPGTPKYGPEFLIVPLGVEQ
ncbi:ferritin-like protein [Streptomyces sp. NPDC048331]|uniref:ferritin-like domain-containing protein n=1 Tax=Streptomyces sp. NPDC048331 TaxID=3365534 RepID=UPI003712BCBD